MGLDTSHNAWHGSESDKELMKKCNSDDIKNSDLEKEIYKIRMNLIAEIKNLTNFFYEENDKFFM